MGTKDITEKILADYNDVFADIVNGVLFGGKQVVNENELENAKDKSQYKFDNTIHEQERDVCKHWVSEGVRFAMFGFEHETGTEPYMPMRVVGYDGAAYRGQLTEKMEGIPKYPVVTIVLYFGMKRWDKPKSLYECMDIPEQLWPYVNDYRINLVEVAFLDDKLDNFHSDFRIIAEYFINRRKNMDYVPSAQEIRHVDEFLKLMQALVGDDRYEKVLKELQKEGKKGGIGMCEVLDRAEKRGISIGEQRGISIGEQRGEQRGENAVNQLTAILLDENRLADLRRSVTDSEYRHQLMEEYGIELKSIAE